MADIAIFRINYKSDFILTLNSDAGWATPFCIKFWTGAPSQAYFAGWDGTTYTHCAPVDGEPAKLTVQFDDHHLPIGSLKFQIAYHFTVADFPTSVEDEVLNQASVIIEVDDAPAQVMLDFNGETAPEIEFSLPAYANEAQRIANEQQRISNEQTRIADEQTRIANEQTRQQNEQTRINQEAARVNEYAELKADAIAATRDANDAAALATQKAGLADDAATLATQKARLANDAAALATQKAELADDAAALATQKAGLANDAAVLATQKAGIADEAATLASQKAQYAQDQGDYAKAQGDYAKSQADLIPAGVTRTATDATFVNADDDPLFSMPQANSSLAGLMTAGEHNQLETGTVYDVSALHPTSGVSGGSTYASLSDALAVIPTDKHMGGMSVKFVQIYDNKYIQARCMAQDFTTDVTQWQGVDDEPTAGSDNLVKSGGIAEFGSKIKLPYILNEGAIVDAGTIANITGYHHTSHLPIIDGYGYEIWGASNIPVYCYSEPKFESSCFLGITSAGNTLRAGTKYVAYRFEDANVDYTNIEIVSKKDIDAAILGTPLMVHYKNYNTNDNTKLRKANINLINNNIRELYFYGSDVDRTAVYHFFVEISSTEVRFIIYDTASRLDKRVNIASNKVVDVLLTQGNYNLHIVADFTNITLDGIGIIVNRFVLSPLAFNAANIPLRNEKRIDVLEEKIDNIRETGVAVIDSDLTSAYDSQELGYILSTNGQKVTAGQTSNYCTDYIPIVDNAFGLKTLCEEGSSAGGAFYSAQNESTFISGFKYSTGADGKNFILIPTNARYFRTSMKKSDYDNGNAVIMLRSLRDESLAELLQYVKPRNAKVLFGYEEFVEGQSNSSNVWSPSSTLIDGSRQNLTLAVENDNARQIWSKDRFYLSRSVFEISLKVNDADSFFSVGATEGTILNELRVHNVAGVGTMEIYVGADSFDTYESITPTIVTSKAMSFNIVAGGEYKLGFRRIENETYNNVEHMDGVEYYVIALADGTKESIFIPRNSTSQSGVRNGLSTLVEGYRFISLKIGDIDVYNMFASSMYAPQAKAMIIGDSYVDGDTLIGTDPTTGCGQKNKFACLLQSAISQTEFVVGGRGGERINGNSMRYILWEITKFLPKYIVIDLGINNSSSSSDSATAFNEYKSSMELLIAEIVKLELCPILMTIPPINGKLTFVDSVNNWVRSSGYRYVDMNRAVTTDADGHTWNPDYVKADGIHPTVLGHEAIYNAFVKELPELFAV